MDARCENVAAAEQEIFDVAIIGAGVNGACLFDSLRRAGYSVVLFDKGDFAGGTSQASAMMVWGGLLYLASLDIQTVISLSAARDRMLRDMPEWASPRMFAILPGSRGILGKNSTLLALILYRALGRFNRRRSAIEREYPGRSLLVDGHEVLMFEEGFLRQSDARFVLQWMAEHHPPFGVALNYTEVAGGGYRSSEKLWHLEARDEVGGTEFRVRARAVANCAGVWTDRVNARFDVGSPVKHVFSKGVFISFPRDEERELPLIFGTGTHNDVICSIPWGPVELWGPTETRVYDIVEETEASAEDVCYLLEQRQRHYLHPGAKHEIVSLRSGIRPLAVDAAYDRDEYPLQLSRRSRVVVASGRPWISVYGGKITGCVQLAESAMRRLASFVPPPADPPALSRSVRPDGVPLDRFPGLEQSIPHIDWCVEQEACCTIEDYLRRRTNVAQWVPREGLGRNAENREHIRELCLRLAGGDRAAADRELAEYEAKVARRFDRVLEAV